MNPRREETQKQQQQKKQTNPNNQFEHSFMMFIVELVWKLHEDAPAVISWFNFSLWGNAQDCPDAAKQQHQQKINMLICVMTTNRQVASVGLPFSVFHQLNGIIDLIQGHFMCDELIHHYFLLQVSFNHLRNAIFSFKPWVAKKIHTRRLDQICICWILSE